jgi:hypothetical protein
VLWIDDLSLNCTGWSALSGARIFHFTVPNNSLFTRLSDHSLAEIPSNVGLDLSSLDLGNGIMDDFSIRYWNSETALSANLTIEVSHWKERWSPAEYTKALSDQLHRLNPEGLKAREKGGIGMVFSFAPSESVPLRQIIQQFNSVMENLQKAARNALLVSLNRGTLTTLFDLPEEVRVPCEQYLLYFSEFLRDVGVDALTELEHDDAGHVLFSVRPRNRDQALEKIKEALELYLRLPMAEGLDAYGISDFRAQQLLANIQHLRGQLALASGMIQLKEATIQQQSYTIEKQRQLLSGELLMQAVIPEPDPEKEQVLGGTVAITKWEGPGIELNFAEMYRKAKKLFKKS